MFSYIKDKIASLFQDEKYPYDHRVEDWQNLVEDIKKLRIKIKAIERSIQTPSWINYKN